MPQHERVVAAVWLCHKIIPRLLHELKRLLRCQTGMAFAHLLSKLRFVIQECAFVQHLIQVVELTVEQGLNIFSHRLIRPDIVKTETVNYLLKRFSFCEVVRSRKAYPPTCGVDTVN